jgi:nifR3 family TIM-barrel protein
MSSAHDVLYKHAEHSRYLYRAPAEKRLAYQISGTDPEVMAKAAFCLQRLGADLIDVNCGCPKTKIRKKGAGSALLEQPEQLIAIVQKVRDAIAIPLTVKVRIQGNELDLSLAQHIEACGADALIVHGRRWLDDYDVACDVHQIARIKKSVNIPVIANGDIFDQHSLEHALEKSGCDGFMLARAGCGKPWLYQELLEQRPVKPSFSERVGLFLTHLQGLAELESEFKAVLQSKSLIRYYFKNELSAEALQAYYALNHLDEIKHFLQTCPHPPEEFDP